MSSYYHNVFDGEDDYLSSDITTHAYWAKDFPEDSVMTDDAQGKSMINGGHD